MKLIWTDPSIADLRAIRDYIGRDSDYYAADLVEQLVLSVERLSQFPKLGRMVLKLKMKTFVNWSNRVTASFTELWENESKS